MKLFIVTVTREAMVWAENAQAAESMSDEIEEWETADIESEEANGRRASGWTDDTNVYHGGNRNITLAEAEAMLAGQPQRDTRTIDMFAEGAA